MKKPSGCQADSLREYKVIGYYEMEALGLRRIWEIKKDWCDFLLNIDSSCVGV
jgi:hypothetical protein